MTLAAFSDANRFLDTNKISFIDATDAIPEAKIADRYVRAYLYEAFGAVVNTWDIAPGGGQESTPEIIVEATAMIMAARRYAKVYSLESPDAIPGYPKDLLDEAENILRQVKDGTLALDDKTYVSAAELSRAFFWPNDLTVSPTDDTQPDRLFFIDQEF